MYFMNSFKYTCLLIGNIFSSGHSLIDRFGIIEDHSNYSEKYYFNSDVMRNCLTTIVQGSDYCKCLEMRLLENVTACFINFEW